MGTTEELPAPPGCRSIATKTCHKVPHIVANKVPYETCEFVPSVKCHLVLKKVAELECVPVVEEECNDFAKEVPYLVGEEECEEVVYDDCFEIEEQVPVLLAKGHVSTTSQSSFRGARYSEKKGRKDEERQGDEKVKIKQRKIKIQSLFDKNVKLRMESSKCSKRLLIEIYLKLNI